MTFPLQLGVKSEAVFDESRKNRFLLRRIWNENIPQAAVCMCNPSKADEERDDPSVRRMQCFARAWGYGGITVVNAYPWMATDPKELITREESPETLARNLIYVITVAQESPLFICAWGANAALNGRHKTMMELLRDYEVFALRITKNGFPEHPLYLPSTLKPIRFETRQS